MIHPLLSALLSFFCLILTWLVMELPPAQNLEVKAFNYLQRTRYTLHGPRFDHERIAFIAIDDQSVDPSYSPFSYPWGQGTWQTRGNYSLQMSILSLEVKIRPAVLAYDILFLPVQTPAMDRGTQQRMDWFQEARNVDPKKDAEILRKLGEVQSEGNNSIQNELFAIKDLREAGEKVPHPIFAYVFTADEGDRQEQRMLRTEKMSRFESIQKELIPEGLVSGASTIFKVINPPAAELLIGTDVGLGSINVPTDSDGVVQKVPLIYAVENPEDGSTRHVCGLALRSLFAFWNITISDLKSPGKGFPTFSAVAGKEIVIQTETWSRRIPVDDEFKLLLNTRCRYSDLKAIPFADVTRYGLEMVQAVQNRSPVTDKAVDVCKRIAGKIALVGQSSTGSGDIGNFAMEQNVPNALAHLFVMDNILRNDFLRKPSLVMSLLICILIASGSLLLYGTGRVLRASAFLALLFPLYPLAAILSMDIAGQLIPLLAPLLLTFLLLVTNTLYHYLVEVRQKRRISRMFSTMVSPRILDLMNNHPEAFSLRGKKTEATMFFSDLSGFTSISEKISAEELSSLLNRYLTPMTDLILESDGYLDKYSGDGIMAVWGVPFPDKDHALKACRSALLQQKRIISLAEEIHNELGILISVRMGINSGQVSAGNMGSEKRFQYTVMGDAVNLAARLEPVNKDYGTSIVIGYETKKLLEDSPLLTRCLDKMVVKGKIEPVLIYELLGERAEKNQIPIRIQSYEEGLDFLWKRDWDAAEKCFQLCQKISQDVAARVMLERVAFYRENPPPDDWNGSFVRMSKD